MTFVNVQLKLLKTYQIKLQKSKKPKKEKDFKNKVQKCKVLKNSAEFERWKMKVESGICALNCVVFAEALGKAG